MKKSVLLVSVCTLPVLLSGCFMDHKPAPTLEERMFADEHERRRMDGPATRVPTLAEYAVATGLKSEAAAFEVKIRSNTDYRFYFFVKTRGRLPADSKVELIRRSDLREDGRKVTVVATRSGAEVRLAPVLEAPGVKEDKDFGVDVVARFDAARGAGTVSGETLFDAKSSGAPLLQVAGTEQRFLLTPLVTGVSGFEIECAVLPVGPGFDEEKSLATLREAIVAEWLSAGSGK